MGLIFISGANITSGGPLEIYRNFLFTLSKNYSNRKVVAIVSDINLFIKYKNVQFIEIKNYKRFIFLKFYYEYVKYFFISKNFKIDLWLSLNDCTPSVKAKTRVVYCHNATPFYKKTFKDYLNPTRPFIQSFYYIFFYKINLKYNKYVIVQQSWIRDFFIQKLKVPQSKVIINRFQNDLVPIEFYDTKHKNTPFTFIYPTKSQPYKNIEVILKATEILTQMNILNFKVLLTVNKNENLYSKRLSLKYQHLKNVYWTGFLSKNDLNELYIKSDCLIFSSKLETWGLPISEFKNYRKPILVSNLPYAHETIGDYHLCKFFNPNDEKELSNYMVKLITADTLQFDKSKIINYNLNGPNSLNELLNIIIYN